MNSRFNRYLFKNIAKRHFAKEATKAKDTETSQSARQETTGSQRQNTNKGQALQRRRSDFEVPFFTFELGNWPYFVWNDFLQVENELENRFRHMERQMDRMTREMMRDMQALEREGEKQSKEDKISEKDSKEESFYHQDRTIETRQFNVEGTNVKLRNIKYRKNKDGVEMNHDIKQIFCDPPVSFDKVKSLRDKLSEDHKEVLDQFLKDADKFEKQEKPQKIERIERIMSADPETGKNDRTLKVLYQNDKGRRNKYEFSLPHEEKEGTFKIDEGSKKEGASKQEETKQGKTMQQNQ